MAKKNKLAGFVENKAFAGEDGEGIYGFASNYQFFGNRVWFASRSIDDSTRLLDELVENGAKPYHGGNLRLGNGIYALDTKTGEWVAFGFRWVVEDDGKLTAKWLTVGSKPEYSNLTNVMEFFDDFDADAAPALALRELVTQETLSGKEDFDMDTYVDCMTFLIQQGIVSNPQDISRYTGKAANGKFVEMFPKIMESWSAEQDEDAA